ncbi:hypothetical protein BWQ96_07637 [Gracilariopsis chorda]|uniref:Myb-like domain-containing protein n=1 Tax=Gracilariopsis chorda TaxID=448386 RepID=A0A2V3IKP8_9FLOR|nr:hypothetical protein BWQ96_07637 [Gracilariopsis chorda]|eukprot:PXF42633.1 hypothetical protein BWQ96_07637 [Gracilariopsis chorda]
MQPTRRPPASSASSALSASSLPASRFPLPASRSMATATQSAPAAPAPPAHNRLLRSVALRAPVSDAQYAAWSSARRRAWDRRLSHPNAYFYHYCHPSFTPRRAPWRIEEHLIFLAAISRIAPLQRNWGAISLLVPGRTGSHCRRYYRRIGRAGFITVRGTIRKRLVCRASIPTFDQHGKSVGRMHSSNPLFRRNALSKFIPSTLPVVDDSLLKPFEHAPKAQPTSHQQLAALTHIRVQHAHQQRHCQLGQAPKPQTKAQTITPLVCRLRIRPARLTVSGNASEHSQSARSSAIDPHHDLLDMHVLHDISSTADPPSAAASTKRVLALSTADRASLAFLLNADDGQPPQKHPNTAHVPPTAHAVTHEAHHKGAALVSEPPSSLATQQYPVLKSCDAPRESEAAAVGTFVIPADNAAHSSPTEGQCTLSAKLEQLRLLLKLFVDCVHDEGVSLGHAVERRRLLQRYEQFRRWLCSGMPESALLKSARVLGHSPRCRYFSPPGGNEWRWQNIVACWMSQVEEMTQRQKHELVSAAQLARIV